MTLGITTAGFQLVGPCTTPYIGKVEGPEFVIKLRGVKDRYTENDFEIMDLFAQKQRSGQETKGSISFDRQSEMVYIEVFVDGKPFKFNGRHRYKIKDT